MQLKTFLKQKKHTILKKWFDLIRETYPPDTANFLRQGEDRFANPAGYIITQGIEILFDELIQETNSDRVIQALDSIIRIRAVQDFTPSQATAFVFLFKQVIRDGLEPDIQRERLSNEFLAFEARIDAMALSAFDVYMKCREEIHRIRMNEAMTEREMALRLLRMSEQVEEQ